MVGRKNGMQTVLKEKYKHLISINCCNHGIENACEKSALNFLPLEVKLLPLKYHYYLVLACAKSNINYITFVFYIA